METAIAVQTHTIDVSMKSKCKSRQQQFQQHKNSTKATYVSGAACIRKKNEVSVHLQRSTSRKSVHVHNTKYLHHIDNEDFVRD